MRRTRSLGILRRRRFPQILSGGRHPPRLAVLHHLGTSAGSRI
jgi:hypothetical protein